MARYIDADTIIQKLKDAVERVKPNEVTKDIVNDVIKLLQNEPTADVQEVKRGKWIEEFAKSTINRLTGEDSTIVYRCSRCGRYESQKEPYCNCGADMRGDADANV